jgi:glucokinase
MSKHVIGIDLGCTNIKAVLMDDTGAVMREWRGETNEPDDRSWKGAIRQTIQEFLRIDPEIKSIGLSAPGLASADNSCIAFMPGRLPGLENFNWSTLVGQRVFVLNDAHAALMAEARYGAARNCRHAILLTLGTGVGGGILIDGQLYQGLHQMAGHLGHVTVDSGTHLADVTRMPGSLEDAIGNLTIQQRSLGQFQTTWDLVTAHQQGDVFATWLWLDALRKLAIAIGSFINVLSPEVVIIGGGISRAGKDLLHPLQAFLDLYEWQPGGKKTPLALAHFSDASGAIGAAAFALSKSS